MTNLNVLKWKISLIGDFGVGKSSLYRRMVTGSWVDNDLESEVDCDFTEMRVHVDGYDIDVALWDTAGMEEHSNMLAGSYFRGLQGFFVVYDVTNYESFKRIDFWLDAIHKYAADGVQLMLLANRADAPIKARCVTIQEGEMKAKELQCGFFEVSARTGDHVETALHTLLRAILAKQTHTRPMTQSIIAPVVKLHQTEAEIEIPKKTCCS